MSPFTPHWRKATAPVLELTMYQIPVDGLKTATSFFPSPSKSPGTGTSPLAPHW